MRIPFDDTAPPWRGPMYDATNNLEALAMYYVFAWHEGCHLGGANDCVGAFPSAEEAHHRAHEITRADYRFEVQVVDKHMHVLFESGNAPFIVRTLDEVRMQ